MSTLLAFAVALIAITVAVLAAISVIRDTSRLRRQAQAAEDAFARNGSDIQTTLDETGDQVNADVFPPSPNNNPMSEHEQR